MITGDLQMQAARLIDQADCGLLITLANAHYVERVGKILYAVTIPDTEQTRYGMELIYEEFMLCATNDPIPNSLATPESIEIVRRLAFERLTKILVPAEYEIVVQMMMCVTDPDRQSFSCDNPLLWLRIGKLCRAGGAS